MFTGIIEETGTIEHIERSAHSIRLAIRAERCGYGCRPGDSIAVNGCCLTAVRVQKRRQFRILELDLLQETWRRTNLQFAQIGSAMNLERALPANGRLAGHFVTGHIDGIGRITRWEPVKSDWLLEITAPAAIMRYIVFKGSIAVDGISLTVAAVTKKKFRVWIIPHTCEVTALRERAVGDAVNLEADILGKYVEKFCKRRL